MVKVYIKNKTKVKGSQNKQKHWLMVESEGGYVKNIKKVYYTANRFDQFYLRYELVNVSTQHICN